MIRIAINGFGRIGRNFLRAILADKDAQKKLDVIAINIGPSKPDMLAHMFKYDTLMGTYPGTVTFKNGVLHVDEHAFTIIAECDVCDIDWGTLNVDWVVDCSGRATVREKALQHCKSGATRVLISAPAENEDIAIIPGVNDDQFDKDKHKIVSLGSCTTNAMVPMLKVLHDTFTIQNGFMTTIHAYTNSQVLLDRNDGDLRRARAAALNIIPTTTGAMKVLGKIMPELTTCMSGTAVRVPVAKVSFLEISFVAEKRLSVDAIHGAFQKAVDGRMKGIVGLTHDPLVSSDFAGNNHSVVIDCLLTDVQCNIAKVCGWYDNEWAYSVRMKDFLVKHG